MSYTWKQFTDEVKVLLSVDRNRLGAEDFTALHIRQAVIDLQDVIKRYRTGHQNFYRHTDVSPYRTASKVTLPQEAQVRDSYLIRWKEDDAALTGLTTLSSADTSLRPQLVASGSLFTEELVVGDIIALASDITNLYTHKYATVGEIVSDDTLILDKGLGNEVEESIFKLTVQRHPCVNVGWQCREELFNGAHDFIDNNALATISPTGELYVHPALLSADADSWKYLLEVNWDGKKVEFADEDMTPFDEETTLVVANKVKAECALHFNKDRAEHGAFLEKYIFGRQGIYLGARDRGMFSK